ncbi:serine/threonine protein kinase (plasmid) [Embleya sp. NBC_00888]|uniref:serine/threonine-protein kinase n=1 Tax=Embleya sp. NBC_00888 TaxID=2975960 RepID=UPI002F91549C|nr:serine/threonine protein kinase [Embleya sp. NBC_00888]
MAVRVLDGRYELVRFVGRGGMGEVWEGRDRRIGRRVAVKLLPHGRGDASGAALFLREVRTAGALDHPGVVTVFDVGQDAADDSLFMVMEFVQGRDLAAVLREDGVPPVADAVEWTGQAATALGRAHTAGIVHRDLKPANLMLAGEGRVKVLDFGIARFIESTNRSSKVMGTLAYMPPERFDEHPGDARSDLYSLGCVLHELLTGNVPFEATGPVAMMNAHLLKTPVRPGEHRPGIPSALDRLVLDLLAKDPDDRPATAEEVRERLHAAIGPASGRTPASAGPGGGRSRENAGVVTTEPNPVAPPRIRDGTAAGAIRDRVPVHAAPTVGPGRAGASDVDSSRPNAASAPEAAQANTKRRFLASRKARVVLAGLLLAVVVTGVAIVVGRDNGNDKDNGNGSTQSRRSPSPSPLVKFETIPDICGNLSQARVLDDLVDHRRPSDATTSADARKCGWETERSPSVPVDGALVITAQRFTGVDEARGFMEKEKGRTSLFGGFPYTGLGTPGDIGDEAAIRVDKENVDKTMGGDAYHSFNSADVVFRTGNLVVQITYMRSRGGEPKPTDTESTRRGAEVIADLVSSPLER